MKATLYTPNNAPQAMELTGIDTTRWLGTYTAPVFAFAQNRVFIDGADLLASGKNYRVFAAENAADYAKPCPSAVADLTRLTGTDWTGENQPYGHILIIEA